MNRAVQLWSSTPLALAGNAPAVSAILFDECLEEAPRIKLPRADAYITVRFGGSARHGMDVYAFGLHAKARRKTVRAGQRAVSARLRLGSCESLLGIAPAQLAGRIVALEDLWGGAPMRVLEDRLASATTLEAAAKVLCDAITHRDRDTASARTSLALAAAPRLERASVRAVASELGVSERTLRRAFCEAIGSSPKAYAKLARFHRALRAARAAKTVDWAAIALSEGYCDQAHMIAEFRQFTDVTPAALLRETELR